MHSYKLADLGLRSAPSNTSYWVFPSRFFSPAEAPKLPTLFFSDWTVPSSIKGRLQPWKLSAICNVPCWLGQRLLLKSSLTSLAAVFSITDGRPSNQRCFEAKEGPRRGPAFLSRYRRWEVSPVLPQFFPFFSSFPDRRRLHLLHLKRTSFHGVYMDPLPDQRLLHERCRGAFLPRMLSAGISPSTEAPHLQIECGCKGFCFLWPKVGFLIKINRYWVPAAFPALRC
jgi:hypothetical protein